MEEPPKPQYIQLAQRDANIIGQKIWMNEGSAKVENLTAWNKGEQFASLGIGHFIWYPPGVEEPYMETFPALIAFLQQQGVEIPLWLQTTFDAPWHSYEAFKRLEQSAETQALAANREGGNAGCVERGTGPTSAGSQALCTSS